MKSGIINVYKEKGFTSFDVVAKLRGILRTKKIGHTGTLDPDAEGVLPVCIGRATKVCDILTDKDKVYEAVMLLGVETDTQDTSGEVLCEKPVEADKDAVEKAILSFVGEYDQVPPMYSALKVNGKKLYELAREGKTVERKARRVNIFSIEILEIDLPRVRMSVHCSKGTYIRTLCHDIGNMLGCGGCMDKLLRTKVGVFELKDTLKLAQIDELAKMGMVEEKIISVDELFEDYTKVWTKQEFDVVVHNGNRVEKRMFTEKLPLNTERLRVYDSKNAFIGIFEYSEERKDFKPVKMFYENN
ncbi:MAG: tRNA pseudouridine(55) synthase TruB [Lachnospiraceae bacterium]|nr:tRNA pseudouridine(55) synthase TruB [Lachnospiraceae bacterium]